MRILILFSFINLVFVACKNKTSNKKDVSVKSIDSIIVAPPLIVSKDSILLKLTNEVLTAFKNNDYKKLSGFVHSEGVRFSPYSFINAATDKLITATQLEVWADKKKQVMIEWGTIDPTDEPIRGTIDYYVKRFVYDVDFLNPEKKKVNEFIGSGNTTNNLLAFYPDCDFTESHFSGFEKKYEGMDWKSIRLVFKLKDKKYYLVGVVHDQWTT